MKNILAIDVGNSNTVFGIYKDGILSKTRRTLSNNKNPIKEFHNIINNTKIDQVAIASVVPKITDLFNKQLSNFPHLFINSNLTPGIKYPMDDPSFIGADLIANIYSAWKKYKANCLIFDFGTATTIQMLAKDGTYFGAVIMPGMLTAAKSLFKNAAQLSNFQIEKPINILGTNTQDALLSGIVLSHTYAVEGYISRLKKKYDFLKNIKIIATGGLAELVAENSGHIDILDKNLTLDGIYRIMDNGEWIMENGENTEGGVRRIPNDKNKRCSYKQK